MYRLPIRQNRFIAEQAGVTAIEYAILTFLVALAIITAISLTGTQTQQTFCTIGGGLGGGCAQAIAQTVPPPTSPSPQLCSSFLQTQPYFPPGTNFEVAPEDCSTTGGSTANVITLNVVDTTSGNNGNVTFFADGGWAALANSTAQTAALEQGCAAGTGPLSLLSTFSSGPSSTTESVPASTLTYSNPSFVGTDVSAAGTPGTQPSSGSTPYQPMIGSPIPSQSSPPASNGVQYVTCAK